MKQLIYPRRCIIAGALFCMIAVGCGAFAAHALKEILSAQDLDVFKKGVYYQFIHAIGLILTGLIAHHYPMKRWNVTMYLFIAGIILFSGSLFILAFRHQMEIPVKIIGPLTPLGGVCFILGWAWIAFQLIVHRKKL